MIDSKYLVVDRPLWEGRQRLYRFENNFGASSCQTQYFLRRKRRAVGACGD